jgi:DNA-binding GntR family transcriptional regulator
MKGTPSTVKALTAEESAYDKIVHLILAGHYKPGDFLLEMDLSRELGMSRTPVSRAIGRLVIEGFLNKIPKKGCFIPQPTPEDAEQVFLARMAVEGEAAASAALKASESEIAVLETFLQSDTIAQAKHDKDLSAQINSSFHLGIAKASHNQYLESWCTKIFWRSNLYIFYFDSFYKLNKKMQVPPQKTPDQHRVILDAIRDRNPAQAAQFMKEHVHFTYEKLMFGL